MIKAVIIGAKGNLGQQLVKIFSNDKEYEVFAWDRDDVDVTDRELLISKIKSLNPDIIINSAAYNAVDKCEESEEEFDMAKRINGYAPGYLAEAASEVDAVLIHYSTDYVFDGNKKEGYREGDLTSPISNYGKSKQAGEDAVMKQSGNGFKWYVIRTSKLFGPTEGCGNTKPSFFDIMLKLSKEKDELKIVDGEVSCFTYTPDLAIATKRLVEANKDYGIYHITNSGSCTWYEAAKYLFELKKIKNIKLNPIKSSEYPRPAKRPEFSVLLDTKLSRTLRPWQEALKEYLNY